MPVRARAEDAFAGRDPNPQSRPSPHRVGPVRAEKGPSRGEGQVTMGPAAGDVNPFRGRDDFMISAPKANAKGHGETNVAQLEHGRDGSPFSGYCHKKRSGR